MKFNWGLLLRLEDMRLQVYFVTFIIHLLLLDVHVTHGTGSDGIRTLPADALVSTGLQCDVRHPVTTGALQTDPLEEVLHQGSIVLFAACTWPWGRWGQISSSRVLRVHCSEGRSHRWGVRNWGQSQGYVGITKTQNSIPPDKQIRAHVQFFDKEYLSFPPLSRSFADHKVLTRSRKATLNSK